MLLTSSYLFYSATDIHLFSQIETIIAQYFHNLSENIYKKSQNKKIKT